MGVRDVGRDLIIYWNRENNDCDTKRDIGVS